MTSTTTIDLAVFETLKESVGADFIGELIDTFTGDTPKQVAVMRHALAQGDVEQFRRAAHSVKSTSANFGAMQLSALAKELEMLAKSGGLDGATEMLARLEAHYSQVVLDLQQLRV